ncbi:hypothetical protein TWF106_007132 [Orbilia oligospora]|uniref:Uncharacterized protein n=1 Tax=Orbilia oligospora TaxID=2813651 RepID=A0A6G1M555_ORBOL|nr:hypothetical protein TWF679_008188 [Orbilia oligospora]KAF3219291.1 hypothetical protein TWF106_007132 [Orbilia oligospora]KAF3220528.1 hypothetical protein TWF191_007427 [Orbilia oligospora]KAF3244059.1 hypothetical protein TWF192_007865 [Orbilia oligospora]
MSAFASAIRRDELADPAGDAGNPDAAQDLYGLGIRLGLYFQVLGWIFYSLGGGKGLKLASVSITIPILVTWFLFASKQLFSPCEAFIVLVLLSSLNFPAKATLYNDSKEMVRETTGVIMLLLVELGICGALLWLFATLVKSLPTLLTENAAFFFAKVPLNGWFRFLALVYCAFDAATSLYSCFRVGHVFILYYRFKRSKSIEDILKEKEFGDQNTNNNDSASNQGKDKRHLNYFSHALHCIVLVLAVLAVELTIKWNHLVPITDFQSPGQLIPFTAGIIILADSIFVLGNRIIGTGTTKDTKSSASP